MRFISNVGILILASVSWPVVAQDTIQRTSISAEGARSLTRKAVDLAKMRNLRMCIAVTDAYGQLVTFEKMDGAITGCVDSSIAKARSSAQFGVATSSFFTRATKENLPLGFVPGILPAAGGVPVKLDGIVIGAIGVSGGNVETETALAADTVIGK